MIRIGIVSQIDYSSGKIKVGFRDRDNPESNWIGLPANEYDPPKVGDLVSVALDYGNYSEGICIGKYYSRSNVPDPSGETICYKRFGEDLVFQYDKIEQKLTITAKSIHLLAETLEIKGDFFLTGNASIEGNLAISESLDVSGAITASSVTEK